MLVSRNHGHEGGRFDNFMINFIYKNMDTSIKQHAAEAMKSSISSPGESDEEYATEAMKPSTSNREKVPKSTQHEIDNVYPWRK